MTAALARRPERGEERNPILEVDDRVVPVPVPPQVACCCPVHAEAAAFAYDEVTVRPVVWRRILVPGSEQSEQGSGAGEPPGDLLGIRLRPAGRWIGQVAPIQEQDAPSS